MVFSEMSMLSRVWVCRARGHSVVAARTPEICPQCKKEHPELWLSRFDLHKETEGLKMGTFDDHFEVMRVVEGTSADEPYLRIVNERDELEEKYKELLAVFRQIKESLVDKL